MEMFVLFRCTASEKLIQYRVLEEAEFTALKMFERDLCARTVAKSTDKDALDATCKEFNNLVDALA
jgi:hypothetical protein